MTTSRPISMMEKMARFFFLECELIIDLWGRDGFISYFILPKSSAPGQFHWKNCKRKEYLGLSWWYTGRKKAAELVNEPAYVLLEDEMILDDL